MKIDKQSIAYSRDGIHLEIGEKQGFNEEPHSHSDEYQIEILLTGTANDIADENNKINPGNIAIYNPNETHQTHYHDTDSFIFHIKLDAIKKIYHEMNVFHFDPLFDPNKHTKCSIPISLLATELQLLKDLQSIPDTNSIEIYKECKALQLLKVLLCDLENNKVSQKLRIIDYYSRQKMLAIKEWIHANFHRDDITIHTLAEKSHLSRFHFIRVFKEVVGKSPYDYLMDVRVNAAINIIQKKKYRCIDEVSLDVGFRNTAQLRYHMKKIKGYLPSQIT